MQSKALIRKIDLIVIHCADSPDGDQRFNTRKIDSWHASRFLRDEDDIASFNPSHPYIGYHKVIELGGQVRDGRHYNEIGAHAYGHNSKSVGWCLVGRAKFTQAQWAALSWMIRKAWVTMGRNVSIIGHNEVNSKKSCPGFDVQEYLTNVLTPLPRHVLPDMQLIG